MFRTRHLICLLFAVLLAVAPTSVAAAQECGEIVEGSGEDPCAVEEVQPREGEAVDEAALQAAQTPTPTPTSSVTPTPTPTGSPTPTPTASSSPSPTATPTATASPAPDGTATVTVSADRSVAQVGATVTYLITIQNTSSAPADVTLVDEIPSEMQFLSATGSPTPAIGSGTLTWTLPAVAPGTPLTFTWSGKIGQPGDLDALNVVTATGAAPARIETHTYLAEVQGISLRRSPTKPDWGTHTERNVISVQAPTGPSSRAASNAPGSSSTTGAASTPLPATGVSIADIVAVALLLLVTGLAITRRGRRFSAAAMLLVLLMTACTAENPAQGPSDQAQTESDEDDEVLGTRVGNDDAAEEEGSEDQGETGTEDQNATDDDSAPDDQAEGSGDTAGGTATDGATDETTDAGTEAPIEPAEPEIERQVVLVEVPNEPPQPLSVGAEDGDNAMLLDWSAASRSIVAASSTRLFDRSNVDLLSSLVDGQGAIHARVTLTNITGAERLLVQGNLVLNVSGDAQLRLTSPTISQVLDPGDEVFADFTFTLPSGSYGIDSAFVPG